jgi:uncharacterized membrane protein HdeD (DUF308 family)
VQLYQDPQYQNTGRSRQYESTSAHQHHERAGRTNQQVRVARSAILAPRGLPGGWVGEIVLGLGVVVLGLIVAIHTTFSLKVLAILLGVAMIVAGVYRVVRSLRRAGDHRMWGGIAGVLFFLVGIWLIRHISTMVTLIALFAGFAFIIAGIC